MTRDVFRRPCEQAGCSDTYVSAVLLQVDVVEPPQLESHCPCWSIPDTSGKCSGIQVPITLSTTGADAGTSYRQCIDPANFDVNTGEAAVDCGTQLFSVEQHVFNFFRRRGINDQTVLEGYRYDADVAGLMEMLLALIIKCCSKVYICWHLS